MTNTDGLLTHPFRGASSHRPFTDIVAEPAGLDHFRGGQEYPAVINTGAEMEDGSNANSLTDFSKPRPCIHPGAFRREQPVHGACYRVTAGR